MTWGIEKVFELLPSFQAIKTAKYSKGHKKSIIGNLKHSNTPVDRDLLFRAIVGFTGISIVFVLIYHLVKLFITDKYQVFDQTDTQGANVSADLHPNPSHYSTGDTLSPLRSRRDFYQNLNNSSQYLRRDSFSQ